VSDRTAPGAEPYRAEISQHPEVGMLNPVTMNMPATVPSMDAPFA
jgi:hypothetical protein